MDDKWSQISRSSIKRLPPQSRQCEGKGKSFDAVLYGEQLSNELNVCANFLRKEKTKRREITHYHDDPSCQLGKGGNFSDVRNAMPPELFLETSVQGPVRARKMSMERGENQLLAVQDQEFNMDNFNDSIFNLNMKKKNNSLLQPKSKEWRKYCDKNKETRYDLDFMNELENDVKMPEISTFDESKKKVKTPLKKWSSLDVYQATINMHSSKSVRDQLTNRTVCSENEKGYLKYQPYPKRFFRPKNTDKQSYVSRIPEEENYPSFKVKDVLGSFDKDCTIAMNSTRESSSIQNFVALRANSMLTQSEIFISQAKRGSRYFKEKIESFVDLKGRESIYNEVRSNH